jgi:hypothetical protein
MTLYGPVDAFLLIDGNDLTPDTFELGDSKKQLTEEVRPFGATGAWDKHITIGVGQIELKSGGGLYDDRQKGIIAALQDSNGSRRLAAYGLAGDVIGAEVTLLDGPFVTKFNRVADLQGLTKANPEYAVSGEFARGRILHTRTAETADFDTEAEAVDQNTAKDARAITIVTSVLVPGSPDTSIITTVRPHLLATGEKVLIAGHTSTPSINGTYAVTVLSPTTFSIVATTGAGSPGGTGGTMKKVTSPGGFADLHVPAIALGGSPGLDLDVLHGSDGVTFIPLLSFATVTAVATTHRQRVYTDTQIERYTAVDGDFTGAGSPSAIPFVALHRDA